MCACGRSWRVNPNFGAQRVYVDMTAPRWRTKRWYGLWARVWRRGMQQQQ